eukprot:5784161-Prymnesium_polylepis.1
MALVHADGEAILLLGPRMTGRAGEAGRRRHCSQAPVAASTRRPRASQALLKPAVVRDVARVRLTCPRPAQYVAARRNRSRLYHYPQPHPPSRT